MSKVMLINPDYYDSVYSQAKVRFAISRGNIPLGLLYAASPLIDSGHEVKVLDLNLAPESYGYLCKQLNEFRPDLAGITAATPNIKRVYELTEAIKRHNSKTLVVAGGPHPSAYPEDTLRESAIDCVVKGEGDFTLKRIVEEGLSCEVPNIYYKRNGGIAKSWTQGFITEDLDTLPYPAYNSVDLQKYTQPGVLSRRQPAGFLETSRGCFARCTFCNKGIFGFKVRQKSPMRVVDEMERMLNLGFREIHIIDDIFTADKKRVFDICEEILKRRLKFPWHPHSGVRADSVNPGLLKMMKKAGCYRILYGVESGSQRVLDAANKRITLKQVEDAVRWAKQAKMETVCAFMLALPSETEEDIQKTIDFAIKLNTDYVKWAITVPLPGTPLFEEMSANGRIKTRDWNKYIFHQSARGIYDHDVLSWDVIEKYYNLAYRRFYFNPRHIIKMACKTALNGSIFAHMKVLFRTKW